MEFSLWRFANLLYRDYILYRRKMVLAIIVLLLLSFVGMLVGHNLINLSAGGGIQALLILFILLLWIGGGWFTSTNLGDLQSAANRIHYLSLPASNFEKILSKWLYTLPIYALTISIIIYTFFKGYLWVYADVLPAEVLPLAEKLEKTMSISLLQLYVVGHAIAFFSSFYFNNYVAIKGALSSLLALLGASIVWALFRKDQGLGFLKEIEVSASELINFLVEQPFVLLLSAPLFWALTYWVFKRKAA